VNAEADSVANHVPATRGGGRLPLRVALLGFGTVGSAVARILVERPELSSRLRLTHVFNRGVARKRAEWVPASVAWTDDADQVLASMPDVVVEVIGGIEPAGAWVRRALEQGSAVVTANKMLLAAHGPELLRLAASRGTEIRFEAAVAGGVPLIHGVRDGLAGDVLARVAGILNGTSNFVLTQMESGERAMSDVLEEARRLGYAEADPSADIDGDDAGAKLVVLAGIAFRRHIPLPSIPRRTIRPINGDDFRYARRLGCTIRQVALIESAPAGFHAFVGPALVPNGSSFARNQGANNVVTILGKYGGENSFSGPGAGGPATAVAVVSDMLALSNQQGHERSEEWLPATLVPPPARPYYLRFVVRDQPGILATIAAALARQEINVDALLQEPGYPKDALPFVITVEPSEEAALGAALDEITRAPFHAEPPLALPILGDWPASGH
jgi:homoserine dehydrogenase